MSDRRPSISQVTLWASMNGKCVRCGKHGVERTKAFTAPTYQAAYDLGQAWGHGDIIHKRCEGLR